MPSEQRSVSPSVMLLTWHSKDETEVGGKGVSGANDPSRPSISGQKKTAQNVPANSRAATA